MTDRPHKMMLDREDARAQVGEYLEPQINLFESLTNYGTNLIVRLIHTKKDRDLSDAIAVGVFLRQVVAMLDSFTVLLKEGATHSAYLTARSAFEASLFLEWILIENLDGKAKAYYVHCLRDERKWAVRGVRDQQGAQEFAELLTGYDIDIHRTRPKAEEQAKAKIEELDRILGQDELAATNTKFDQVRGKRRYDPHWYELFGVRSIRALAVQLQRVAEYEVFYSKGASIHHASNYGDHFRFKDGQIRVKSLRHLENATELVNFTGQVALHTFALCLRHYRPSELQAFSRKYATSWREAYLGVPTFNYSDNLDDQSG